MIALFSRTGLRPVFISLLAFSFIGTTSCGSKSTVEDNETPSGPVRNDPRSRLTGGTGQSNGNTVSYCRLPLDFGTVADPRRPDVNQNVLVSRVDSRCSSYQEARITIKSSDKVTLVGKFICRNGVQFNEQVCSANVKDILSASKTSVSIPIIADQTKRGADVEAYIEFY